MPFRVAIVGLPGSNKTQIIDRLSGMLRSQQFTVKKAKIGTLKDSRNWLSIIKNCKMGAKSEDKIRSSIFWRLRMRQRFMAFSEDLCKDKNGKETNFILMDGCIIDWLVYDIFGCGTPREEAEKRVGKFTPKEINLVLFIDTSHSLIKKCQNFQQEGADFIRRVADGYKKFAEEKKLIAINSQNKGIQEITQECSKNIIQEYYQ